MFYSNEGFLYSCVLLAFFTQLDFMILGDFDIRVKKPSTTPIAQFHGL